MFRTQKHEVLSLKINYEWDNYVEHQAVYFSRYKAQLKKSTRTHTDIVARYPSLLATATRILYRSATALSKT